MTELKYILYDFLADTQDYDGAYKMIVDSIKRDVWNLEHPLGRTE